MRGYPGGADPINKMSYTSASPLILTCFGGRAEPLEYSGVRSFFLGHGMPSVRIYKGGSSMDRTAIRRVDASRVGETSVSTFYRRPVPPAANDNVPRWRSFFLSLAGFITRMCTASGVVRRSSASERDD